ncbi:MAG: 6-phosphogluconolactonase [Gemmatimonadota bacterium]|nr:MAG: 6-phosphogluconolactonase [Gemmatimonadota bacterium]
MSYSAPRVQVFEDAQSLADAAAGEFVRLARENVARSGRFTVALSGGSTPKRLYRTLAGEDYRSRVAWGRVHFFWGDERDVPADHPDSNFGAARDLLLAPLDIPSDNVHPMMGGSGDAAEAATEYEEELRRIFGLVGKRSLPRFDLVLLGLGADGHTASLFPGSGALTEDERLVMATWVERLHSFRITLTCPVFNHAACILFLVAGAEKAETLRDVLERPAEPSRIPAQLIRPSAGELSWYVDRAAASLLSNLNRR